MRAAILAALVSAASAKVWVPSIFSDGAVFQAGYAYDQRPFVYGYADAGEMVQVNISADGKQTGFYPVVANATGYWIAQLNSIYSTDPFNVTIAGSSDNYGFTILIKNVVGGDVFLCSGQSNADFSVLGAFNGTTIASQAYPWIRLFAVPEAGSPVPQRDTPAYVNGTATPCWWWQTPRPDSSPYTCNTWQVAQPGITEYFSAFCFFTALQLSQMYTAQRPIGLIFSAVGGTSIINWAPPEALSYCNITAAVAEEAVAEQHEAATAVTAAVTAPTIAEGPSYLYNAMIYPLENYALRAAFWYQAEADSGQPAGWYSCAFQSMIEAWRRRWRIGDFAFMFVQLAPQFNPPACPDYSLFKIRMEQAAALPAPGAKTDTSGMAVAYDLGDRYSPFPPDHVHPRNKTEVGRRLAMQLLHVQYALQFPSNYNPGTFMNYAGPALVSATASAAVSAKGAAQRTSVAAVALRGAAGPITVVFSTLDNLGVYLGDTHDCWECCATGRDTFQVAAAAAGPWTNTTIALAPGTNSTLLVMPVTAGAYTYIRYAPNTFPQCAVYSVSSQVPSPPFQAAITPAATPDSILAAAQAAVASAADRKERERAATAFLQAEKRQQVPVAPRTPFTQRQWQGRTIGIGAPMSQSLGYPAALTPPMGFNSWNPTHCNVDENFMRLTADRLVSTGLAGLGYTYVNTDDCMVGDRTANGTLLPDPARFPSGIKALADYHHSLGLFSGQYTAQGSRTCQSRPGAYGHELQDAATYCEWGLDYLKDDNCGGTSHPDMNTSWILFRQGLDACYAGGGRGMVLSVEYCSDPNGCGQWITKLTNLWRTTGDIQATWASMTSNLDSQNDMAAIAGPGHVNDPDMLQVGNAGMSYEEQKTHFSAWAVVAAPLLIGTDLVSGIDNETMSILSAPEVIAVDQDPLVVQGQRVSPANATGVECWAKPLQDGSVAALLMNRGLATDTPVCTWQQLGFAANTVAAVRDLWARASLGTATGSYSASVPSHGVQLVKITPSKVVEYLEQLHAGGVEGEEVPVHKWW